MSSLVSCRSGIWFLGRLCMGLVVGMGTLSGVAGAFGPSLDELYRDVLREENGGTLPPFVLNRGLVPFPEQRPGSEGRVVDSLSPEEGAKGAATDSESGKTLSWDEAVKDVAGGYPGPFAVKVVKEKAEEENPNAVELLAWMYANGVGVARDLAQAFELYIKADALGVVNARNNAQILYKSMTPVQRQMTFNPFG